jgi:hypothetical protein
MGDPMQAMRGQESVLNPTDMAMKSSRGEIRPDMTIRDFYQTLGLDVDRNTMADLSKVMIQQGRQANPMNKMQAMAGRGGPAGPGGMPGRPAPGGPPQGAPPGLDNIMEKMR